MTFGMFNQLITSASALDLYRQYYSSMDVGVLVEALIMDPTFTYQKLVTDPDWGAPDDPERRLKSLSRVKFGSYTKQILAWFRDMEDIATWNITTMVIPVTTSDRDTFKDQPVMERASVFAEQADSAYPHHVRTVKSPTAIYMLLTVYNDCLKYIPEKMRSINVFRTMWQFVTFMTDPAQFPTLIRDAQHDMVQQDVLVFYEDDNTIVLSPTTFKASRFFCGFTEWCTANPRYDSNHYNRYTEDGILVDFLSKEKDRSDSFQIYVPAGDSPDNPEMKDGYDNDLSAGRIAAFEHTYEAAIKAVSSKIGRDLKKILDTLYTHASEGGDNDEDDDDPITYEATSGYVFDPITFVQNPAIITPSFETMATVKIIPEVRIYRGDPDHFDYDENDNGDYVVLTIMPFDLSLFDNSLAAFPEIDFTVPGMVVVLNEGNRHDFQQSFIRIKERARDNYGQNGDLTIDDRGVLDSYSFSEEEQAALGFIEPVHPGDTDLRTFQFSSRKVFFVMFIGLDEEDALLADNDYIIKEYLSDHGIGVGQWYDTSPDDATTVPIKFNGKEVEAGVIYRHDTMVTNLYDAMENNSSFAKFMAGEGVISTPMQRKTSKQQDFRFENRAPQKRK